MTQVAEAVGLELPTASLYLRALNARGLLGAKRSGRCVFYSIAPNSSVQGAQVLVQALCSAFAEGRAVADIFKDLTAFTHPRRVDIVRALQAHDGMCPVEIRRNCMISMRALRRHLTKLEQRGIVSREDRRVYLRRPDSPLAQTLVDMACTSSA